MSEQIAFNPPVEWVKQQIMKAGTTIGSVQFLKRTDNSLRKMCYRLHVHKPSIAKTPKGIIKDIPAIISKDSDGNTLLRFNRVNRRLVDKANDQMTVLDANKVIRDESGKIVGRGAWRTIPLDRVVRIVNKGTTTTINRDWK